MRLFVIIRPPPPRRRRGRRVVVAGAADVVMCHRRRAGHQLRQRLLIEPRGQNRANVVQPVQLVANRPRAGRFQSLGAVLAGQWAQAHARRDSRLPDAAG